MLKSSFQGKITNIKKKGQYYVVSIKTGRDVIKCITSVDVLKNGLEKGNTLYLEGYYSIKNALFPITNLYKVVNGKKIAINIEEHHFYEQIETMPPMTKKKRGKDGNYPVPETLRRENSEDDIGSIAINVPVINPENLVSKTKPVASGKSVKVEKSKHTDNTPTPESTKTEKKVVETKEVQKAQNEVEEETPKKITETKVSDDSTETTETKVMPDNLFGINIPNLTAELEESDTLPETEEVQTETPTDEAVVTSPVVKEVVKEETADKIQKENTNNNRPKTQILFDEDLGLPLPVFNSTNVSTPTISNAKVEEKPKVSPKNKVVSSNSTTCEKPPVSTKKTEPVAPKNTTEKAEQGTSKYPVKFSSSDLM